MLSIKENASNATQDTLSEKGNIIDWFLGIVGVQPSTPDGSSLTQNAPKNCLKCSKLSKCILIQ